MIGTIPKAPFAGSIPSKRRPDRRLPQAIAHRGYKAAWPENTMAAFRGAVDAGAHAVETDVHLSADGVIVLSHDASLKRCFGVDKSIASCDWEYLSTLRTVREPPQGLPRLRDLLAWLGEPGRESIWLMLDIKLDDDTETLMAAIAATLGAVPTTRPWPQRVLLGCWNATSICAARRLLPSYTPILIAWYLPYATRFLVPVPLLAYSIYQTALVGPAGARFLRATKLGRGSKDGGRQVFTWTVNDAHWMEWCLGREDRGVRLIDGVITDDPKMFLEICERWEDEQHGLRKASARDAGRGGLLGGLRRQLVLARQYIVYRLMAPMWFLYARYVIGRRFDLLTGEEGPETPAGTRVKPS